jgi:hypothetical protein
MHAIAKSPWLLAAALLLASAGPALANAIAPSAGFFPGFLPLALWMALPASVLAAFLERPFVTRAGVVQDALWYSLQANLLSLALGYLTLPAALAAIYAIPPLWSMVAVSVSIYSEGWYYRWRALRGCGPLRWRWVVLGNICSSLVLLSLPLAATAIKEAKPSLAWELEPYHDTLLWGSAAASVLLFGISWVVPTVRRRGKDRPKESLHLTGADIPVSPDLKSVEAAPAGEL